MSDCLTCRHSMARAESYAWRLERDHGYRRGHGYSERSHVLCCDKHKLVAPTPSEHCGFEPIEDVRHDEGSRPATARHSRDP